MCPSNCYLLVTPLKPRVHPRRCWRVHVTETSLYKVSSFSSVSPLHSFLLQSNLKPQPENSPPILTHLHTHTYYIYLYTNRSKLLSEHFFFDLGLKQRTAECALCVNLKERSGSSILFLFPLGSRSEPRTEDFVAIWSFSGGHIAFQIGNALHCFVPYWKR